MNGQNLTRNQKRKKSYQNRKHQAQVSGGKKQRRLGNSLVSYKMTSGLRTEIVVVFESYPNVQLDVGWGVSDPCCQDHLKTPSLYLNVQSNFIHNINTGKNPNVHKWDKLWYTHAMEYQEQTNKTPTQTHRYKQYE